MKYSVVRQINVVDMASVIHTGLAVLGRNAVPTNVHEIRCRMKHVANREEAIVLDCMIDEVTRETVQRAAAVVRDMHREARQQGRRLRVQVGAACDARGHVVLSDGTTKSRKAFVRWMASLVSAPAPVPRSQRPVRSITGAGQRPV